MTCLRTIMITRDEWTKLVTGTAEWLTTIDVNPIVKPNDTIPRD